MPRIKLRRGIVIDRCQPHGLPPAESARVTRADFECIRALGVDHVKLLFTPSSFQRGDALDTDAFRYAESVVGHALAVGLPCLVCLHPEAAFKETYLASEARFCAMLDFYRQWARETRRAWSPDAVAFQLMTEPFANYTDWNVLHPRLWEAVRAELPEHTLVLSGDRTGSLLGLLELEPVADDNVYYGFTSYDPFAFTLQSWNAFFCGVGAELDCVGRLPYPASPEIVEARLPEILATVPEAQREAAMAYARAYGRGDYQQGNDGVFDRAWHEARMLRVEAWRERHGARLPVLCNEFGVMDAVMGRKYGGPGCLPDERVAFLRDMHEAMEAHDIGWSYWSYNETFTLFQPETRTPFGHDGIEKLDGDVLVALGLSFQ